MDPVMDPSVDPVMDPMDPKKKILKVKKAYLFILKKWRRMKNVNTKSKQQGGPI